ncbi:hypothetical protein PC129_g14711 [Phytophthora cactorum]|uniref:Uncharacterized protein n=1 Tax=Phytophthora cactorum TaxID=29920 RepID=A0A8T1CDW8_9STRA|nr:hypothetical protein PC114_g17413 [Phytophthora cactorum]KAG2919299.1 hypothetical protein PC117_g16838 [Phytophthora cactorum]KAG3001158.1 hypothetical protein PC119_g16813 [Phytophthora cactorum]KAG3147309.1 hypothetical protein C6341_g17799 [Phytophthora cactorum]KAG3169932.1 hypothetical protein PC128_g19036 [Phytophthora cactorum]
MHHDYADRGAVGRTGREAHNYECRSAQGESGQTPAAIATTIHQEHCPHCQNSGVSICSNQYQAVD